jgi:hypothetical protein
MNRMTLGKALALLHATPFGLSFCAHWHANTIYHWPQNVQHTIGGYSTNPIVTQESSSLTFSQAPSQFALLISLPTFQ